MPTYEYHCKKCDLVFEESHSIEERRKPCEVNRCEEGGCDIDITFGKISLVDPVRLGRKKPDDGFRDVLKEIKRNNRGSNINTF